MYLNDYDNKVVHDDFLTMVFVFGFSQSNYSEDISHIYVDIVPYFWPWSLLGPGEK